MYWAKWIHALKSISLKVTSSLGTAESPTYKYMALYKFKGKYYFKLETKNKEGDVSASNDLEFLEPETKLIKETIGDPETFVQEYENAHVFNNGCGG